jgi:hypothetical protein
LASGYGDSQNPYASKTQKHVLAAPNGADGVPTFRALVADDIPLLNQNTTGYASSLSGGNNTTQLGSLPYQSGANTTSLLSPNITATKKFLRMTGDGTNGAAPAWDTIVAGDIPAHFIGTTSITFNRVSGTQSLTGVNIDGTAGSTTTVTTGGSVTTTVLTTGAAATAGTITGDWSLSAGSKLQSTYADLAENYVSDQQYDYGIVLMIGGDEEVTIADADTQRLAGVVSQNPAYLMNSECEGKHVVAIALQGRTPVRVKGNVRKGDFLVSAGDGYAKATDNPRIGSIIGKSLESFDGQYGMVEAMVGRI